MNHKKVGTLALGTVMTLSIILDSKALALDPTHQDKSGKFVIEVMSSATAYVADQVQDTVTGEMYRIADGRLDRHGGITDVSSGHMLSPPRK